jgi:hypothetical protein
MDRDEALAKLRYVSVVGHLIERAAPTLKMKDAEVEYLHVGWEGGMTATYDAGLVQIAHGEIGMITLAEVDEKIAALERGEDVEGVG